VTGILTPVMTPQGQLRGQKRLMKIYFDKTRSRQVYQRVACCDCSAAKKRAGKVPTLKVTGKGRAR